MEGDFRLGEWLVCPKLNTIQKDGRAVRIEHKFMQVLVTLAARPGEIVSKEELIRSVWKDTFVTDDVLTRAISELRRVFADDAKQPRIIETVAKSGYRLLAPVQPCALEQPTPANRRNLVLAFALLVLAGISAAILQHRFSPGVTPAARVRSIAVLPLQNLSLDPEQEYLADGMTEALINDLSRIGALRVISRTTMMQYKATHRSIPEIARELNVDAVVEGTIQPSSNRVRVSAELIDGKNDADLWAQSFDRDLSDVLMLESDVAQAVTSEIQVKLTPADVARISAPHPVNCKAHDAYLRGRYLASRKHRPDLEQSIAFYQQAVDDDPQYSLAYTGIADSYISLEDDGVMPASEANPKIRAAAMNAVAADPNSADAHLMLADARETEWDWTGAEREYRRAIELNPGLARAHHWYALLLSSLGRHEEAIAEIERAADLEPLAPELYVVQAEIYFLAGRDDQALLTLNALPILQKSDPDAILVATLVDLRKGDYADAICKIQANAKPGNGEALAFTGYAYAVAGRKKDALYALNELQRLSRTDYIEPGWMAMIWAALGDHDKAMELLRVDYQLHSSFLMTLANNPAFASLHSEKRFQDMLHSVGLPMN